MASALGATLERQLDELRGLDLSVLIEQRYQKFRAMGALAGIEE
jgi:acetyl-CoA carboxylase alpha subunit